MAQLLVEARAHIAAERFDAAIKSAKKAAEVFAKLKESAGGAEANCYLIKALIGKGDLDKASAACSEADACMKAEIHLAKGETDKALLSAKAAAEAASDSKGKGEALVISAKAHLIAKDAQEAVVDAESAVKAFTTAGDQHGEATAWALAMDAKFGMGTYQAGVGCGNAALALFGACEDDFESASVLSKLASAHVAQKEVVPALSTGMKALRLLKDMKNKSLLTSTLNTIVQAHVFNGNPDSAVAVAKPIVGSMKKTGVEPGVRALATMSLWRAVVAKGEETEAAELEAEVLSLCRQAGDKELEAQMLLEAASLKSKSKQFDAAKDDGEAAKKIFAELKNTEGQTKAAEEVDKIEVSIKGAPEQAKLNEAAKQEQKTAERAVLFECVEAYKAKDKIAFHHAFKKLQESQILTQDDVNEAFWPLLDFDPSDPLESYCEMDWIWHATNIGEKHWLQVASRPGWYMLTRVGGMNYGPNFRQMQIGAGEVLPFNHPKYGPAKSRGTAVFRLHNEIVPEGDWEKNIISGHAGMIDQVLGAQAWSSCNKDTHPDDYWKGVSLFASA
mmetsp:Transcript_3443/g.6049  ORF Transcript_3443/g.6049 Transcript_3443/m.6049 type:complete len:560 (+) Transcript_3443:92-1771(+)